MGHVKFNLQIVIDSEALSDVTHVLDSVGGTLYPKQERLVMDFATYKNAGLMMALNAALHFFVFLMIGFTPDAMLFVIVGVVYGFLAWGLFRSMRWLAYIVFLIALLGMSAAISMMGTSTIPSGWLGVIVSVDALLAVILFFILWAKAKPRGT